MNLNLLNINSKSNQLSQTKKVALTGVMAALIAVTTIIAIPLPPPLSTINLAPVIIFAVAILLGPYGIDLNSNWVRCWIFGWNKPWNNNSSSWISLPVLGWFSGCQRSYGGSCRRL